MDQFDITKELGQLLFYTGEAATAIRKYSPYGKHFSDITLQDSQDIFWISEMLHHFSSIGEAAKEKNFYDLYYQCKRVLMQLNFNTERIHSHHLGIPEDTFNDKNGLAMEALTGIKATLKVILNKLEPVTQAKKYTYKIVETLLSGQGKNDLKLYKVKIEFFAQEKLIDTITENCVVKEIDEIKPYIEVIADSHIEHLKLKEYS